MNENVKKVKGHLSFSDVFEDATKHCRKIPASNYLESGIYQIIDQGQNNIAGYTNDSIDLYTDTPVIIFGDHTRVVKYIDKPFFIGADGVKVLKPKTNELNTKYLYYVLSNAKIPNTGYNRHFKWLKEIKIPVFSFSMQEEIVSLLNKIETIIDKRKQQLENLDKLIKSQFIEMFGEIGSDKNGWGIRPLADCCDVNPKKGEDARIRKGMEVSFVPMQSVSEQGDIDTTAVRTYEEVQKGFTYFSEGDVLFAKITPCMENGKGAIARGLKNSVGFGSTEFHVLRPKAEVCNSEWIYAITSFPQFRQDAARKMTGSAGQRRVPASFLASYMVSCPPIELQEQFADFVEQTDKSKFTIKQSLEQLEILKKSLMQKYFG